MPKLIKAGAVIEDRWHPVNDAGGMHSDRQILTLEQWEALDSKIGSAVQLEPDHAPAPLLDHLADIELVAINFPVFTDGRGFSYGRELRERGFTGELRAVGYFLRDQLHYLARCGFDAFQFADDGELEAALSSLADFDEHYQASVNQPLPLFRRRA